MGIKRTPYLESWPLSLVAWSHRLDNASPVFGTLINLTLCAGTIPARSRARGRCFDLSGDGEAASWHATVRRRSLEPSRVRGCHDIRHHRTRASSRHENLAAVATVFLERVVDHILDGFAVTATIMHERRLAGNVPACPLVGRFRVDDNETVLVGQPGVGGAGVVRLRCPGAVVDGDDDRWLGGEGFRHIDIHFRPGWVVGGEVGDLGQGCSRNQRAGEGTAQQCQSGGEMREAHVEANGMEVKPVTAMD